MGSWIAISAPSSALEFGADPTNARTKHAGEKCDLAQLKTQPRICATFSLSVQVSTSGSLWDTALARSNFSAQAIKASKHLRLLP